MASSWVVIFCFGWDQLTAEEHQVLERHFSAVVSSSHMGTCWEVKVRSATAVTAVREVSLMIGPDREDRLVYIAAAQDLAERVRAARPGRDCSPQA